MVLRVEVERAGGSAEIRMLARCDEGEGRAKPIGRPEGFGTAVVSQDGTHPVA